MEEPLFNSIYSLYCKHMLRKTSGSGSSVSKVHIEMENEVWVEYPDKGQWTDNPLFNNRQEDLRHHLGAGHWETQQGWRTQEEEQYLHRL